MRVCVCVYVIDPHLGVSIAVQAQAHIILATLFDLPVRSEIFVKMRWEHFSDLPTGQLRLSIVKDRTKTRRPLVANFPEFLSDVYLWWRDIAWPVRHIQTTHTCTICPPVSHAHTHTQQPITHKVMKGPAFTSGMKNRETEFVFCQQDGVAPRKEIRSIVIKLQQQYIGTHATIHSFRHSQVSETIEMGVSEMEKRALCSIRQHKPETAERYYVRQSSEEYAKVAENTVARLRERRQGQRLPEASTPTHHVHHAPAAPSAAPSTPQKFCSSCGTKLAGAPGVFCGNCGARL